MKFVPAVALAAALVAAPLPSQAFLLNEEALNYKMHIIECLGLLFDPSHADVCGGNLSNLPLDTLATPVSSGPSPGPKPPKEPDCEYEYLGAVENLAIGDRVHVAVDCEYPTESF